MKTDLETIIAALAEYCEIDIEIAARYVLALLRGIVVRG